MTPDVENIRVTYCSATHVGTNGKFFKYIPTHSWTEMKATRTKLSENLDFHARDFLRRDQEAFYSHLCGARPVTHLLLTSTINSPPRH